MNHDAFCCKDHNLQMIQKKKYKKQNKRGGEERNKTEKKEVYVDLIRRKHNKISIKIDCLHLCHEFQFLYRRNNEKRIFSSLTFSFDYFFFTFVLVLFGSVKFTFDDNED